MAGCLQVVTEEIGDGWLYGVPSDPLRNAMFKEVDRQRTVCVGSSGECDVASPGMRAFDRLLVKVRTGAVLLVLCWCWWRWRWWVVYC